MSRTFLIIIWIVFVIIAIPYYLNRNIPNSDKYRTLIFSIAIYFFTQQVFGVGFFVHLGIRMNREKNNWKNPKPEDIEKQIDNEIERLKEIKRKIKENE